MKKPNDQPTFSIDSHCIACTTCTDIAPMTFDLNINADQAIIIEQPKNSHQLKFAKNACQCCPVSAIQEHQS